MTTVQDLQREFAEALCRRSHGLEQHLQGNRFAPKDLLQIYRNNFVISLSDALAAGFPMVKRLVGEAFFEQAACRYVLEHPPTTGNVMDYGADFPQLLAELAAPYPLPYLADLARLEWDYAQVANLSGYQRLFPFTELAELDPGKQSRLIFELNPSARLRHSPYPIFFIYQMVLAGQVDPIDLQQPQSGVLWRLGPTDTRMMTLAQAELRLLELLQSRLPLQRLLDEAGQASMETIQQWIGVKLITHFSLKAASGE